MKMQRVIRGLCALILLGGLVFPGGRVFAGGVGPTFTVTLVNEGSDAHPGDGVCAIASGPCTLRAALQEANANVDMNTIQFALPGSGVRAMTITSPLPNITSPVLLDGTSQANCNIPCIVLSGAGVSVNGAGLVIRTDNSRVFGFIITSWKGAGIVLYGSNNILQMNVIGFWPNNPASLGNQLGVIVQGVNNLIGGTLAGDRNYISGNLGAGVAVTGEAITTMGNKIKGNYIGTDLGGNIAKGNKMGIWVYKSINTLIGGFTPIERNLISGNNEEGIQVVWSGGTTIVGNFIGTNALGTGNLGNHTDGIMVTQASINTTIGGTAAGSSNRIAFNSNDGVAVRSYIPSQRTSIRRNLIYSNGQLGIDLANNGVTPNDLHDLDIGPNGLQNFPALTAAHVTRVVNGQLNSKINQVYILDFFANPAGGCDPSHYGEGQRYIGSTTVTTNSLGTATFSATMTGSFLVGAIITATATDSLGNTSEFSQCRTAN